MKFYLKYFVMVFIYFFFSFWIASAIEGIQSNIVWLKAILYILNLFLFLFVIAIIASQEGKNALKLRHDNDVVRENIIKTGQDLALKTPHEEYLPIKGFLAGLIYSIPHAVCMIIYAVMTSVGKTSDVLVWILKYFYKIFYMPFGIFSDSEVFYYVAGIGIILTSIAIGLGYIIGAKIKNREYETIKRISQEIHGEKY